MTDRKGDGSIARLAAGIMLGGFGLLVAVVVVGLARDNLDSTGVATVLSTLVSGVAVGLLVKGRGEKGDPP